jgi:hypothetical protein
MPYEEMIQAELKEWERSLFKPPGVLQQTSKTISSRVNSWIPQKVHHAMTSAVKGIVQAAMNGNRFLPERKVRAFTSLMEADDIADELISRYKKVASAEGAGTGVGGIFLGAVDFTALIAIKMRLLFELAHVYGFSTNKFSERLFILHIFQLAFSGTEHRKSVYAAISNWEETARQWPKENDMRAIRWEALQQEYRDSIDFRKLLQMVPKIGALVGAWANFKLIEELGETAKNCYRMRILRLKQ